MAAIRKGDDDDLASAHDVDLELVSGEGGVSEAEMAAEQEKLRKSSKIAKTMTAVLTLALLLLWPIPMYGSSYIFSKPFFTGWVVVGIMWLFFALGCVGIYPLWEGKDGMAHTFKAIYLDVTGKQHPSKYHTHGAAIVEGQKAEKSDGLDTPPVRGESNEKAIEVKE
jgi:urea-proton symporter